MYRYAFSCHSFSQLSLQLIMAECNKHRMTLKYVVILLCKCSMTPLFRNYFSIIRFNQASIVVLFCYIMALYQSDLDPDNLPPGFIAHHWDSKTGTWRDPITDDVRPFPYYCTWCKRNVWLEDNGLLQHTSRDKHKKALQHHIEIEERVAAQQRRKSVCVFHLRCFHFRRTCAKMGNIL